MVGAARHAVLSPGRAGVLAAALLAALPVSAAQLQDAVDELAPAVGGTLERSLEIDTSAVHPGPSLLPQALGQGDVLGLPDRQTLPGEVGEAPLDTPLSRSVPAVIADRSDRHGGPQAASEPLLPLLRDLVQFLRAQRHWLLGAALVAALLVLGAQAWRRQRRGTSGRQLGEMAQRRSGQRSRRRT